MSLDKARKALDARLEAFPAWSALANKPIAWENAQTYKPATGTPYLRVNLLPARTENPTLSGDGTNDLKVLRGIYQLRLYYPPNAGPGAAAERADALVAHFPRGTTYTYGGVTVRVKRTPWASPALEDGPWYVVPVSIEWYAEIH